MKFTGILLEEKDKKFLRTHVSPTESYQHKMPDWQTDTQTESDPYVQVRQGDFGETQYWDHNV